MFGTTNLRNRNILTGNRPTVPEYIEHPMAFTEKLFPSFIQHLLQGNRRTFDCIGRISALYNLVKVKYSFIIIL